MKRLLIAFVGCFSLLEAQNDSLIVATVGAYRISSVDLLTSYGYGNAFVIRFVDISNI